jgi:ribosome-associated protein
MAEHDSDLTINGGLTIPRGEYWYEFAHAGGPGGQNVNKVESQVSLCFHVEGSGVLAEWQKRRIREDLGNRINKDGILRITARESRSQETNRRAARERLRQLIAEALRPRKRRKRTRPTRASKERRLDEKHHRAVIKRLRKSPERDD